MNENLSVALSVSAILLSIGLVMSGFALAIRDCDCKNKQVEIKRGEE